MSHVARWGLRDAGVHSRIYQCHYCEITREVPHPGGVGADRVQLPREVHNPEPAPWGLPHMEEPQPPASRAMLLAEMERVEAELGNAIYMHRAAWVKARQRRDELDLSALDEDPRNRAAVVAALCETDPKYKRRIADVQFWRAERDCLAASVLAVKAMIDLRPRPQIHVNYAPPIPRPRDWEQRNRQGHGD